eukprot:UN20885
MHVCQSYFEKLLVTELCSGMSSNVSKHTPDHVSVFLDMFLLFCLRPEFFSITYSSAHLLNALQWILLITCLLFGHLKL